MAFNRDGQMLATAGEGRVILWSLRLRRALEDTFDGAPGHASAVTFSANGRYIAVAAQRGVAVRDRRKLALLRSLKTRDAVLGHVAPAQQGTPSAAFSPDARLLAWSLSTARRIVVWRLADHREILRFPGARAVAFSPDGKQLAASVDYFPSDFIVVNVATGERTRMKELPWATGRSAPAAAPSERPWTSDGGKGVGASAALDGTVTLWDTRRSQPIATLRAPGTLDRPFLVFDRAGQKLAIRNSRRCDSYLLISSSNPGAARPADSPHAPSRLRSGGTSSEHTKESARAQADHPGYAHQSPPIHTRRCASA